MATFLNFQTVTLLLLEAPMQNLCNIFRIIHASVMGTFKLEIQFAQSSCHTDTFPDGRVRLPE